MNSGDLFYLIGVAVIVLDLIVAIVCSKFMKGNETAKNIGLVAFVLFFIMLFGFPFIAMNM